MKARQRTTRTSRPISPRLQRAYRATLYCVRVGRVALVIRIGEISAGLRAVLQAHNCRGFAFITAWNPGSRKLSRRENNLRHARLLGDLRRKRLRIYPGWGRSADGRWREKSVFVPGIRLREAVALGSRYGQLMIVASSRFAAPRLVRCPSKPRR